MDTTYSDQARRTSDLAARLTDFALEVVSAFGHRGESVETELTLWHALQAELQRELGRRTSLLRFADSVPPDRVLQQIVRRAALQVAGGERGLVSYRARRAERSDHFCGV